MEPKKKTIVRNSLIALALLLALLFSTKRLWRIKTREYTNDAQIERFITPINSRVSGYIREVRFIEHQAVKKGDTLVIIDDRELQIQCQQAAAAYLDAQANLTVLGNSVKTVGNNVSVMNANLSEAKARLQNAEANFKRYQNLLTDGAVTRQQYDQLKTEFDAAKARYEALIRQKQTAQLSTTEVGSRNAVVEAAIMRTKAMLDMAKLNLSYTVITAPEDGVMGRRTIQPGQLLQPGQSIASIVSADQVWVAANYLETQLPNLYVGQPVEVSVDAVPGEIFKAKVTAISSATGSRFSAIPTDNSTGNFVKVQQRIPVRINFTADNDQKKIALLQAGMNVEVEAAKR